MIYKAYMKAFCKEGTIREIEVPQNEINHCSDIYEILELIFKYGQNMFQSRNCPSLSVGDIVEVNGKYYDVKCVGFEEIDKDKFKSLNWERAKNGLHFV